MDVQSLGEKKKKKKLECVEFNVRLLRIVGCWPDYDNKSCRESFYKFYTIIMYCALVVHGFIQFYGVIFVYPCEWKVATDALEDMHIVLASIVVLTKIMVLLRKKRRIEQIMNDINIKWNKEYVKTESDRRIIQIGIQHEKRLTGFFCFAGYGILVLYCYVLTMKLASNFDTQKWAFVFTPEAAKNFNLGYLPWKFPFPITNSLQYLLIFGMSVFVLPSTVQGTIGPDCVVWALVDYHCRHFYILTEKIRNSNPANAKEEAAVRRKWVKQQLDLMRSTDELQSVFGPLLFIQFTLTSVLIGTGLFQATEKRDMSFIVYVKDLFYFTWTISQMFVYSYYGQKLTDQTLAVQDAVYDTPWYEHLGSRNENLIALIRSQRPFELKIAGVFSVSMENFRNIMNTSYSYFTLLVTVNQD